MDALSMWFFCLCDCCLGLEAGVHVAHTWGTGWAQTVQQQPAAVQQALRDAPTQFVIASDILLYVRYCCWVV